MVAHDRRTEKKIPKKNETHLSAVVICHIELFRNVRRTECTVFVVVQGFRANEVTHRTTCDEHEPGRNDRFPHSSQNRSSELERRIIVFGRLVQCDQPVQLSDEIFDYIFVIGMGFSTQWHESIHPARFTQIL